MSKRLCLSEVLKRQARAQHERRNEDDREQERKRERAKRRMEKLQLEMLKFQQGVWHRKARAILVFEGFDASGKGGCIRQITERLDPRGIYVHPIGPPDEIEQKTHWLYRFWAKLPRPGTIAVFDRSWYGRVLVERVEGFAPKSAWQRAYREIDEFERMLTEDGVEVIKFFLAVSAEEQLRRFRERLQNPLKQWKLTMADIEARKHWKEYVKATDELLLRTNASRAPWNVIPSDDKIEAQLAVLGATATHFSDHCRWIESLSKKDRMDSKEVHKALKKMEKIKA